MESFHKLYKNSLQENLIDENDYECQCNNFTTYLEEIKNEHIL